MNMNLRRRNRWTGGNRVVLLENGEAYFPAVFDAIDSARHEVLVETFILFEDQVGLALREALLRAAARGVQVDLLVDGFGSADLTSEFIGALCDAGVRLRVFNPARRIFGIRFNVLRRMHRKLVVVDGRIAFVGGINFSADHLISYGPEAKQDYAVSVEGPIVAAIRNFARRQIDQPPRAPRDPAGAAPPRPAGEAEALFVTRDNVTHHNSIERHYRAALRSARRRVVIANAYFFPGWLLLREMRRAARRGVEVCLILQGKPDMPIVRAATLLYHDLQDAGVRVFEYCQRPLHGKVAVVDDRWATVGSSNLDPLSLSLNLEANLIVRDRAFNRELAARLETLMRESCREVAATEAHRLGWWGRARTTLLFHVLRRFPVWAGWLPRHRARAEPVELASSPRG
jgi:cardiolipin synthase